MSRRRRRGSPSMDLSDANAEKPSLAAILNNAIGEMTNPLRPIAPMNRLNFPGGQGIMNNRGSNEIIRNAISSLMNNDNNRHPPVQHDSYHPHEGGPPHRPPFVDSQNIRPHNEPPGVENPGMGPPQRMSNPINPVQNNVPPQGMPPYSQGPFMNPPASMQQNQAQIQPMVPPMPFQSMGPMPMVPTFPPPMMPIQFVPIPYPTVPKKKSAKKTPKSSNEEFADLLKKRSSQTAEVDVKVDDIAGTKTQKIKTKSKGKSTVSNNETTPTTYSDTVVIPKFRYNMHKQLKEIKSLALRKAAAAAVAAAATSTASSSTSSKAATSNATVTTATTKTEVSILPVRTTTKTISTIKIIKPTFKALQMQPVDINTESKTSTETPKKYSRSRSRTRSPRSRRRSHSRSRRRSHSRSRRRSRSRSRHSHSRSRRSHSRSRRRTRSRSSSHRHDYRRGRDRKRDGHDDSIFKEIYGSNYSTKEKKRSPSPPPKIKTSSPNVPRRSRSRSNSASFDRKKGWKNSSKSPENKKENDTVGSQDTKHEEISDRSKHVSKKDVTEPPKERVRRRRSRSISRERRPLKRDRVDDRYRNERPVRSFSPKRRSISPVRRSVSPVSKRNMERRYPLIDDLSSRSPEQRERLVHDGPILRDPAIVARLERERSKMPPMHDPIPSRPIDPYRPREHYDTPYRDPYFESRGRVPYTGDRHLLPPIERYRDPRLYERPLEYRDDYRPPATSAYDPAYDRRLPPRDYLPPTREYREGLYERNPIPRDVPYEEKRYDEERMPPSSSRHDLHDNSRLSWRSRMSHGDSTLDDFAAPINRPEDDINYKQESSERVNSFGDDVKNIEFNSYDRPPSTHSSVQQREISSTNSELAEHSEQYMQPENQPEMLPDEDRRDDYEPLYTSGEVTQGGHRNENHFQSSNVQKNSYGDDGQNNLRDLLGINAVQLKGYLKEFGVE